MLTRSLVEPFDKRAKQVDKLLEEQEKNRLFIELEQDIEAIESKPYSYPSETTDEVLRAPLMGLFSRNNKVNQTVLVVQHENVISFLESEIQRCSKVLTYLKYRNDCFPVDKQVVERMDVLEKTIAEHTELLKHHQEEKKMEQTKLEEILPSCEKVLQDSYLAQMAKIFF